MEVSPSKFPTPDNRTSRRRTRCWSALLGRTRVIAMACTSPNETMVPCGTPFLQILAINKTIFKKIHSLSEKISWIEYMNN